MKSDKIKELRGKTKEELEILVKGLKENLASAIFDLKSGKTANIKQIKDLKKEIAIIFTIIKESQNNG
ncbi:MAG: 50S ribosomal protein L29 [Candidatus Paceibacterota bacterium]|jgi:ribosomal protein L29